MRRNRKDVRLPWYLAAMPFLDRIAYDAVPGRGSQRRASGCRTSGATRLSWPGARYCGPALQPLRPALDPPAAPVAALRVQPPPVAHISAKTSLHAPSSTRSGPKTACKS